MLTDPQSLTINGTARSLARTGTGENSGSFRQDTGATALSVSHTYGKRNRDVVRVTDTKTTTDPLITGSSFIASMGITITIDSPPVGYTVAEKKQVVDGVLAWLTASSGAKITQILGGES